MYEEKLVTVADQVYVLAKHWHKIFCLANKVDYIISDSPLLLSIIYKELQSKMDNISSDIFASFILELIRQHEHYSFLIKRSSSIKYEDSKRWQNEEESNNIQESIKCLLDSNKVQYDVIQNDYGINALNDMCVEILKRIGDRKNGN